MPIFHQVVDLKPGQIAYLAQDPWRLYVEAIDRVADKPAYWVRPLILTRAAEPFPQTDDSAPPAGAIAPLSKFNLPGSALRPWYDVRAAAHLIWPQDAFQPALDTDLLPWFPILHYPPSPACAPEVKRALHRFLQDCWDAPRQAG